SATEAELVATSARLNNVLRRFGSGWALFFEAERLPAAEYPQSGFPDPVTWLVDEERRAAVEGGTDPSAGPDQAHHESVYHLTLVYLPPPDPVSRAEGWLTETPWHERGWSYRDHLAQFQTETDRVLDLLSGVMSELTPLDDDETLTYL